MCCLLFLSNSNKNLNVSKNFSANPQYEIFTEILYRGADKSLARPGRKQFRKHVRDARDFNNIETRAVIKFLFLQGKAPKEIHAILTETLVCFLPGQAKDLSAPLYIEVVLFRVNWRAVRRRRPLLLSCCAKASWDRINSLPKQKCDYVIKHLSTFLHNCR